MNDIIDGSGIFISQELIDISMRSFSHRMIRVIRFAFI